MADLEAAEKAGSRDDYALASFRLTIRIRSLCDNHLLSDIVQSLALQTLRYSRLGFGTPQGIARSLRDWQAVVRAVRRREPEKAAGIIRRRIAGSRDAALEALRAEQVERVERKVETGAETSSRARARPGAALKQGIV